ncbi:MAG: Uma2 family endonuclease [Saprospiraceae bacterium]|nr:Uma2 family endonuclease [Saprospiraceae bacterium]
MKEYALTNMKPMSVEDYIESEERSEIRHEFIDNQLIPMPGTTDDHNEICFNIKNALKQIIKNLRVYTESVKVQIASQKDYTYPDVMIAPDPRDQTNKYIKQYPTAIFEVISRTSRIEDSVDKFVRYKNIESLQNYILVDSEKGWVEVRFKTTEGEWESNTYQLSDERFPIPVLGISLNFSDVYDGVRFQ